MTTSTTPPATLDPSDFHYYDEPQRFTVELRVSGTASITVTARNAEEASAKAAEIYEVDDWSPDMETCDDIDESHIVEHPTRTYLVTDPTNAKVVGSSRLSAHYLPREPDARDDYLLTRPGTVVSWK